MKQHTNKHLRRALALFMTVLMAMSCFSATFGVISFAAADGSTLIGRYFSTDNVWYDAAKGANGIQWQMGDYPAYNASLGMTYFNGMYVRIDNNTLFQNVNRDTGVTFAFNYRPNFTGDHRHILSLGQNAYGNGTENQFFISGATSWYSGGHFPVVAWMNGGSETIKAYPEDLRPELGREYNIVVTVDKDAGVVFYVDGVKRETAYVDSDLNGQIGNVRGFLDAVHNYGENYIGCSRWTADAKIEGYLSDVRIYKTSVSDTEAYSLVSDMAGASFNLSKPSFNATAYHYSDPATGAYSNLAYSSPETTEDSGMGIRGEDNSDNYKDIYAVYFKFFTPLNVVMVYDGAHETYASMELETKRHNKTNVQDQRIYYVVSNSSLLKTRHNWYGYLDSEWKTWAGAYTNNQINTDTNLDVYVGSTNDTPRFWWNALKYTGTGNTNTYYDHEQNVSFTLQAFYDLTVGGTSKGTGTITTNSNYYVLNYKPVYDILDAASATYNNEMNGKAWMYTEQSYAKAMLAMRRLALCNPNLYDYGTRGVDSAAQMCAAAIKQAKADYDAIALVKKTGTVTFNYENGTLFQNVTEDYGDAITIPAVPTKSSTAQYNYINPVWTPAIEAGTVMNDDYKDKVFTASYTESLRSYDITWNYTTADGQQSVTTQVNYGTMPTAPAAATNDYQTDTADFTFTGWSPSLVQVEGEKNYIAQYSSTPRTYSITYKDGDTILTGIEPATYTCGTGAAINGTYSKAGYTFNGWKDENGDPVTTILGNVYGDITLYADLTIHQHNIIWKNGDETVKTDADQDYGTQSVWSDAMPTTADAQYTYTAIGWNTDPDATTALDTLPTLGDEDLTLYAIYDKNDETHRTTNTYPVTITAGANTTLTVKNGDTVLASGDEVPYGTVLTIEAAVDAHYTQHGVLTVKVNDEAYTESTYTVIGVTSISTEDIAEENINKYTVIWKNGDETVKTDADQDYGTQAVWSGDMPTTADEQYTYTAIGWNTDPDATTALDTLPTLGDEDLTLYAIYDKNDESNRTVNKYTVKWIVDGVETETTYEYGATPSYGTNPTKAEDATYTYEFSGWSPEIAIVTGNATYTAQFTATAKTANYTNMDAALEKADAALAAAGITDDVKTAIETAVATAKQTAYNKDGEGNYTVQKTLDEENAQQKVDAAAAALMNAIQAYFDIDETTGAVTPKDAALKEFTVTWKKNAETEAIKTVTVKYGKAVDSADIPDAPADDYDATKHYTYAWADTDLSAVTENKTVLAVATGTNHSFSDTWTWAEDASTATVALSCDCGYSETQNGTVSQKSHTNGTCLAKETTVYTATYGAYTAPDKTVEGDYGDHVYNAKYDQLIRPVKDENGTWSNGTKIWYCQTVGGTSNDEHNKTASVARANYDAFDELIAKVQGYLDEDITDEFRTAINNVLDRDEIKNLPDNLIVDEQTQVDAAVTILNAAYAQAKEGGILDENGNITDNGYKHYTITFVTDGSAVENITGVKKGDEIALRETTKDGFRFEGWYTDETHADGTKAADPYTVTGDVTLYAFFEELSLNGDDVEAAIATATAGVSGICYTEESYTAYTNAVAAVRAFKNQSATTENLTAYHNALAALDAAVAGLVAEHAYTGEATLTRPVKDAETGIWSKGVKTWTCANNADHPVKTEEVDRADYATYDSVLEQINDLLDEDLLDDVKTALEEAKTTLEAIPQNYIEDEQTTLDNAIHEILDTLKGNDKIDVDENNSITVDPDTAFKTYTLTLTNNVNTDYMEFTQKAGTTARLNPGLAGYTLQGFSENANYNAETGIYTFPQADDTITALYVKDLTNNQTITDANKIIADETNPDSGKDYACLTTSTRSRTTRRSSTN